MVGNTFKESKESYSAQFKTKWGWIDFILGSLIFGFLVLKWIDELELLIRSNISTLPQFLIDPVTWLAIGIISSAVGLAILLLDEMIIKFLGIKNKQYI